MICNKTIGLLAVLFVIAGCNKMPESNPPAVEETGIWEFYLTKGEFADNEVKTFRATLLHNGDEHVMSDGAYCGYYKSSGWLYPCAADDKSGKALDENGNIIEWDDENWFNKIDKDSKHALRSADQQGHTLVISSPAIRMEEFVLNGTTDTRHWGFPVERDKTLYISEPMINLDVKATWIDNHYIYPLSEGILYDRKAKVTVKVACGALQTADLKSVHIQNVMTSAYYIPKSKTYENYILDGGYKNDIDNYYTKNTYETLGIKGTKIVGEKLIVPENEPDIHLTQRADKTKEFTEEDEWDKESNNGLIVTAIPEFTVFSLDYSELDGDKYRFNDIIPEVIVYSGNNGNIRSTVSLPVNFEPMTSYTVIIYLSTAYVQAELFVDNWNTEEIPNIKFGETIALPVTSVYVDNWIEHPSHPSDHGTITNTNNE